MATAKSKKVKNDIPLKIEPSLIMIKILVLRMPKIENYADNRMN